MFTNSETKGLAFGFIGVTIFAITLPATKLAVQHIEPIFIGTGRALLAAIFAALCLLIFDRSTPTRSQLYSLLWVTGGVVIGFPILSAMAMQSLPASHGGVVLGALPLCTAIVGALLSGDRPSWAFWGSAVLGSSLVVYYTLSNSGANQVNINDISANLYAADALLFAAVVSAAVGYAIGGRLAQEMASWKVICWALVISVPFLIIPTWVYRPSSISALPSTAIASFLYLSLFSQLIGFFAWYRGLALGGVSRVSQLQLIQPFITILFSALLVGELISQKTWFYALAVVGCVALSRVSKVGNSVSSK